MPAIGQRLLVADDDLHIRELLEFYLRSLGFRVTLAADGAAALAAIERTAFDAAVIDLRMPGLDGIELVRRAAEVRPGLPFVLITGFASDRAVIDSMNAGVARFLRKPFDLEELRDAVTAALRSGEDPEAVRAGPLRVSAQQGWVEISAPSHREFIERLDNLFDQLVVHRVAPAEAGDLRIALTEIVTNAMEWGSRGDPAKPVRVSYCLFPGEIVIKVEDFGPGFRPEAVPDPQADPLASSEARSASGKRPGGFGLAIARRVMDRMIHNQTGNCVVMSKRLTGKSPDANAELLMLNAEC
jgi:CheY-like chemotaxis protein/anti-sigma regulatory factor (Ser/Thr protein kinase)